MVRTKEEILETVRGRLADDTSDEAITLIEDINDTIDDLNTQISEAGNWKAKYEENDANWRTKYKERFFKGEAMDSAETPDGESADEGTHEALKFENLFTEEV